MSDPELSDGPRSFESFYVVAPRLSSILMIRVMSQVLNVCANPVGAKERVRRTIPLGLAAIDCAAVSGVSHLLPAPDDVDLSQYWLNLQHLGERN